MLVGEALADSLLTSSSDPSGLSDIGYDSHANSIFPEEISSVGTTTVAETRSHPESTSVEFRGLPGFSLEVLKQLATLGYRFFVNPDAPNMLSWGVPDSVGVADYLTVSSPWPTCVRPRDSNQFSTFDSALLNKQIRQTPGNETKMWAVGFDATLYSRSERLKRQDIALCPYNLNGTRDAAEKFSAAENWTLRQLAYNCLCVNFSPWNNSQVDSDECPEFRKLATAFFNGQEIPEDLDTLEEPDPFSPHCPKIDKNGDRAKVVAARPLEDKVLIIFLEDVMMSKYLEDLHREHKHQIFGNMKVYRHSSYIDVKEKLRSQERRYGRGKVHQNDTARATRQNRRRKAWNKMFNDDMYAWFVGDDYSRIMETNGAVEELLSSRATSDDSTDTEASEVLDTDGQVVASRVLELSTLETAVAVHAGRFHEASLNSSSRDLRSPSPEAIGRAPSAAKKKRNKSKKKNGKATALSSKEEANENTTLSTNKVRDKAAGLSSPKVPTVACMASIEKTIATDPVVVAQELGITDHTMSFTHASTGEVAGLMPSPEPAIQVETTSSISKDSSSPMSTEENNVLVQLSQKPIAHDSFGITVFTDSSEEGWETVKSKSAYKPKEKVTVSPAGLAHMGNFIPSRTKSIATRERPNRPQNQPVPNTASISAKNGQSPKPQAAGEVDSTLSQVVRVFDPIEYPAIPSTGSKEILVKSSAVDPRPVVPRPTTTTTNFLRSAKNMDSAPPNVTTKAVSSDVTLSWKLPEARNTNALVFPNTLEDLSDPEDLYGASPPRRSRAVVSSTSNSIGPNAVLITSTTNAKVEEKPIAKDSGEVSGVEALRGSKNVKKTSVAYTKDHKPSTTAASEDISKTQRKRSTSATKDANVNIVVASNITAKVEGKSSVPSTEDVQAETNSAAKDVPKPSASDKSKIKGKNSLVSEDTTSNAPVPGVASTTASKKVKEKGKSVSQELKGVEWSSSMSKEFDSKGQPPIAASDNVLLKASSSSTECTNGPTSKQPKQPRGTKLFRRGKLESTEKALGSNQPLTKFLAVSKVSESNKPTSTNKELTSSLPVAETSGAPPAPKLNKSDVKHTVSASLVVKAATTAVSDQKPVGQSISNNGEAFVSGGVPSIASTKPPKISFEVAIALARARGELPHPDIFELTDSEDEAEESTENAQRAKSQSQNTKENADAKEFEVQVPSDLKWVDFSSPIKLRSRERRFSLPSRINDKSDDEFEGAPDATSGPYLGILGLPIPGGILSQVQTEDPFTSGDIPSVQQELDRISFTSSFTDDGEKEDSHETTHLDVTPGTELMVTPAAPKTYEGEPYINVAGRQVLLFRREAEISQPPLIHQSSYSGSGAAFEASHQRSYSGYSPASQSAMSSFNPGYGMHGHPMAAEYGDQSSIGLHGAQLFMGNQAPLPSIGYQSGQSSVGYQPMQTDIGYQSAHPASRHQASQSNAGYSVHHGDFDASGSQAHSNMGSSGLSGDLKGKGRDLSMSGGPSLSPILEMSTTSSRAIDPKPDHTFTCTYCEQIHRPTRSNPCYLCPFCGVGQIGVSMGPKYCSRACLLANAYDHYHSNLCLGLAAYENFTNTAALGEEFIMEDMPIKNIGLIPDSPEKFRQKMCSMYYKYGKVPNILNAHVKKMPSIGWRNILPAYEKQTVGDYHVFKSNTTGGTPSKSHIICTVKFLQADPMKSIITRLLSCCFLMQDPYITQATYRILRFYLSDPHIFPTFNATATQENVLKEFRAQFFKEFGLLTPEIESEPWYINVMATWMTIEPNVAFWENNMISLDGWNRRVFTYV